GGVTHRRAAPSGRLMLARRGSRPRGPPVGRGGVDPRPRRRRLLPPGDPAARRPLPHPRRRRPHGAARPPDRRARRAGPVSSREVIERAAELLGERARQDEPLGPRTTYRVGGPAALFATIADDDDVAAVARAVRETGIDVLVVGKGSSLLVHDDGFPGLAITLAGRFLDVEIDGTPARAGAAAPLPVVARRTAAAGLTGFEWAVGVPGSIGGAVRM